MKIIYRFTGSWNKKESTNRVRSNEGSMYRSDIAVLVFVVICNVVKYFAMFS